MELRHMPWFAHVSRLHMLTPEPETLVIGAKAEAKVFNHCLLGSFHNIDSLFFELIFVK